MSLRRSLAACAALVLVVFASRAGATRAASSADAPAPPCASDLAITLASDGAFLQVGRPVRIRVTLENRCSAPMTIPNGALFGEGVKVRRADGPEVAVDAARIPEDARHPIALPADAKVTAILDLAELLPKSFAEAGRCTVTLEIAGAKSEPLELELARDWTGWHAVIETAAGEIELEFFPDKAPRTVANFLALADRGFYDGLTFHRIVKGFMVQGGDPKGDGNGTSGVLLPFEKTGVKHERGVISMARQRDFDSASCQFFLVHQTAPFLDGNYAAFGRIVRGIEVLDKLCDTPCVMNPNGTDSGPSKPKERVLIQKVRTLAPSGAK